MLTNSSLSEATNILGIGSEGIKHYFRIWSDVGTKIADHMKITVLQNVTW
jgi:hypothetical protein